MRPAASDFVPALAIIGLLVACSGDPARPEPTGGAHQGEPSADSDPSASQGTEPGDPGGEPGVPTAAPRVLAAAGMKVVHGIRFPTRLTLAPDGSIYVSDADLGSVFHLGPDLHPVAELKNLASPLGVAVDAAGRIYVGSRGHKSVEVYEPDGALATTLGDGTLAMPNDLALDRAGLLYVADSRSDGVVVFGPDGALVRVIGATGDKPGLMRFPAAIAIHYAPGADDGELLVGDQGNARIQVFGLDGVFRRTFGEPVPAFSNDWQGRFVRLHGLDVDALGRILAVDSYVGRVQVLDRATGAFIQSFGGPGRKMGELLLPLDVLAAPDGRVLVANAELGRIDVVATVTGDAAGEEVP